MAVPPLLLHRRAILHSRLLSDESRERLLVEHLSAVEGADCEIGEDRSLSCVLDDLEAEVRPSIDLAFLDGLAATERLEHVRSSPPETFSDPRLGQLLLSRARVALPRNRKVAMRWAQLAEEVAHRSGCRTLQALSLSYQANVLRLQRDLSGARHFLEIANELVRATHPPLEDSSEISRFEALLARDSEEAPTAVAHLRHAVVRARLAGDDHLAARALIALGLAYQDLGLYPAAVAATREALPLLACEEPEAVRLRALAQVNLALQWGLAGEPAYARRIFAQAEDVLAEDQRISLGADLGWIEGFLRATAGELSEAATLLRSTFDRFRAADDWYHALAVALDLVVLYLRNRDEDGLAEIGDEILAYLQSKPPEHEKARAILRLLSRVVRREETPPLDKLVKLRTMVGRLNGD